MNKENGCYLEPAEEVIAWLARHDTELLKQGAAAPDSDWKAVRFRPLP